MNARLGIFLVCFLNLTAGGAIGIVLERIHRGPPFPRGPEGMVRALGLSSEQETRVRAILDKHRPDFEKAHTEHLARLSAERDRMDEDLRSVLTDEQLVRLVEHRREFERREREFGPPGPPPRRR